MATALALLGQKVEQLENVKITLIHCMHNLGPEATKAKADYLKVIQAITRMVDQLVVSPTSWSPTPVPNVSKPSDSEPRPQVIPEVENPYSYEENVFADTSFDVGSDDKVQETKVMEEQFDANKLYEEFAASGSADPAGWIAEKKNVDKQKFLATVALRPTAAMIRQFTESLRQEVGEALNKVLVPGSGKADIQKAAIQFLSADPRSRFVDQQKLVNAIVSDKTKVSM
jgi:hypothetical protein